jgi:hypothetical protein
MSGTISLIASTILLTCTSPVNQSVSLTRPFVAAGIATIASTIDRLTTPLFNYLFDQSPNDFNGVTELVKQMSVVILTHTLINHTTPYNVNLITTQFSKNENFFLVGTALFRASCDVYYRICGNLVSNIMPRQMLSAWGVDFNSPSTGRYFSI